MRTLNHLRSGIFYLWVGVCLWLFLLTVGGVVAKPAVALFAGGIENANRFSFEYSPQNQAHKARSTLPVLISFPKLNHEVQVTGGLYNTQDKSWTLTKKFAHYALITDLPSEAAGNTFIYGHNTRDIFGRLPDLSTGDRMSIATESGDVFNYRLVTSSEVEPTDLSAFAFKRQPVVTVQTCSGVWNEKRKMFTFLLESVT